MKKRIRIGIIGCGKITERASLPSLASYQDKCTVVSLCDIIKERAIRMAEQFSLGNAWITRDWRLLVERRDIDAVFVNTPNYLHAPMTIGAARCKKHVLVEKPITISLQAANAMVKACHRNRVFLMVEQTQRFDPVHRAAKEVIASGVLGKIHNIRGRIGHAGPEYWSQGKGHWFYDRRKSGGGCLVDIGVHILDLVRWFKATKVIEVFARLETMEKKIPVEDNATVLLRFSDGAKGEFECSWTTRPFEVLTFVYGANGKMATSIGSKTPVVVTLAKKEKGQDPNHPQSLRFPQVRPAGAWENAIHYFVDSLIKGRQPFVSGEEGRETMKVILAAYESNRIGRWVKI